MSARFALNYYVKSEFHVIIIIIIIIIIIMFMKG